MGQEIERVAFSPADFERFDARRRDETSLLEGWYRAGRFERAAYVAGFELEAWLLDHNFFPLPRNEEYLARLASPLVVPELSRFNVELNGTPQPLAGQALLPLPKWLRHAAPRCGTWWLSPCPAGMTAQRPCPSTCSTSAWAGSPAPPLSPCSPSPSHRAGGQVLPRRSQNRDAVTHSHRFSPPLAAPPHVCRPLFEPAPANLIPRLSPPAAPDTVQLPIRYPSDRCGRALRSSTARNAAGCCVQPGSRRSCSRRSSRNWARWRWCREPAVCSRYGSTAR
jgi:hypothetical protein